MTATWLRRAALMLACASAALLGACGSGTTVEPVVPQRIIVFGDALSDVGQGGGKRYTVNDNLPPSTYIERFASRFGFASVTPAGVGALPASGAFSYAQGNARVESAIDGAGGAVLSVAAQIDRFLQGGNSFGPNDVVVLQAGTSDITANVMRYLSGAGLPGADAALTTALGGPLSEADMRANIAQAGAALGGLAARLNQQLGAPHVLVVSTFNLARTPWAAAVGQQSLLQDVSIGVGTPCTSFNCKLMLALPNPGPSSLPIVYVDIAGYLNNVTGTTATGRTNTYLNYGLQNVTTPVCTSIDAGQGIGTGAGQLNSLGCDTTTLADANYNVYAFADRLYFTPAVNRIVGDTLYAALSGKWR